VELIFGQANEYPVDSGYFDGRVPNIGKSVIPLYGLYVIRRLAA
jgi:hypothetical protein